LLIIIKNRFYDCVSKTIEDEAVENGSNQVMGKRLFMRDLIITTNRNYNGDILRKDRSRWEIVQDLLKVTQEENKAKKTRIMQRANLDWRNFQRYFGFLLEEGLIENCDSNCYELTKRGEELIRRLDQVGEILNRKV
jgi:predicted transcriptional regulator